MTVEQWFLHLAEQARPSAWDMKTTQDSPDVSREADFEEWLNGIPETPPLPAKPSAAPAYIRIADKCAF